MFELPSIGSLVVSTVVFFVAAWYLHHHFDAQELPRGMTRTVLVLVLASMVSWASGSAVDWAHEKFTTHQPAPLVPLDTSPALER